MTDRPIRFNGDMIRAVAASQPADPVTNVSCRQPVKVKPLVWVEFADRGAKAQAWNEAHYVIQKWRDGRWELNASYLGYSTSIYGTDLFHSTIEAAKAAAQADYEARILSALEPAPVTLAEALKVPEVQALVDALEFYADRDNYELVYERMSCNCCTDIYEPVKRDEGDTARAALAALKDASK